MKVQFQYDNSPYLEIREVSVRGSWDGKEREMEKEGDGFRCSMQLPPGKYWYKFRINGELELNDPYNNLYEKGPDGEFQSVLLVNEQGERLYHDCQYKATLEDYILTDKMAGNIQKKTYFDTDSRRVMAGFSFSGITGLHVLTAAWCDMYGNVFQTSENAICGEEGRETEDILWFWMDLEDVEKAGKTGMWRLRLFADGEFLLEDMFTIGNSRTEGQSLLL